MVVFCALGSVCWSVGLVPLPNVPGNLSWRYAYTDAPVARPLTLWGLQMSQGSCYIFLFFFPHSVNYPCCILVTCCTRHLPT